MDGVSVIRIRPPDCHSLSVQSKNTVKKRARERACSTHTYPSEGSPDSKIVPFPPWLPCCCQTRSPRKGFDLYQVMLGPKGLAEDREGLRATRSAAKPASWPPSAPGCASEAGAGWELPAARASASSRLADIMGCP